MLSLAAAVLMAATSAPAAPDALPSPERRQELLFEAARLGRSDIVEPLVRAGADIDGYDRRGFTPLILAAYSGHLDTVETLIEAGANPCKPDANQGNTAQMGAAFKGENAIAERLLKAGCDVNARNHAGQTALMMAALFNRTHQIELLVTAGADALISDTSGRTASSVARAQGNEAVAAALAGAEPIQE